MKLKAAVSKFGPLQAQGLTIEELEAAIAQDEKGYSADEVKDILNALTTGTQAPPAQAPAKSSSGRTAPAKKSQVVDETDQLVFEEWRMEKIVQGIEVVLQKLKRLRERVKITQAEADTLNEGAKSNGSYNPIMYFLPE